jgi:hypothetical protein
METKHFYDLWECNADGFPIKQFGVLPEFCIPSLKEGDPTVLTYLDGWGSPSDWRGCRGHANGPQVCRDDGGICTQNRFAGLHLVCFGSDKPENPLEGQ